MRNTLFAMRIASLLATASLAQLAADPREFAFKVSERVRTARGPLNRVPTRALRAFAATGHTQARELAQRGHYSQALARASKRDRSLATRLREELAELNTTPPASPVHAATGLRVLHMLTNSAPHTNSGYTVRSHHVLKAQRAAGIEVQALTRLGYPVLIGKIPAGQTELIDGIPYHRALPWVYPRSLPQRHRLAVASVVAAAREMNATVLHTTTNYTNARVVADAARVLGIPWIYEVRGELEATWLSRQPLESHDEVAASEFYRLARAQETECMKAAARVVALSEISRAQLVERGVDVDKIVVVPNAIDATELDRRVDKEALRAELGLPQDAVLVGTVSAMVDYEGLDALIDALDHLPESYSVLIVGEGTARPVLQERARRFGRRVIFAGKQPHETVWKWYGALDAFAVPRKNVQVCRTVTPIKPLTAMALGVPVVASDLPALREVTDNTAVYVTPEDPRALADGLRRAVSQGTREPGEAVRARTWQANGQRYRYVYESLT